MPETPRWCVRRRPQGGRDGPTSVCSGPADCPRLVAKGKHNEALALLQRYHGSGVVTPYVAAEYAEMKACSHPFPAGFRDRWRFDTLVNKKGDGHRLFLGESF